MALAAPSIAPGDPLDFVTAPAAGTVHRPGLPAWAATSWAGTSSRHARPRGARIAAGGPGRRRRRHPHRASSWARWPASSADAIDDLLMRVDRGVPDGAHLHPGAGARQRPGSLDAERRHRDRHLRRGPPPRAWCAPRSSRCASATTSTRPAWLACGRCDIAFREVLPGALHPVIALVGVTVGAAILVESSLAFLGLSDPNQVSWGGMIADGREVIRVAPLLVRHPGHRGRAGGAGRQPASATRLGARLAPTSAR